MRKFISFFMAAALMAVATPMMTSCGDDDDPTEDVTLNKTDLDKQISDCEELLKAATTEDYPEDAITTFRELIDSVKAAEDKATTQSAIDALVKQLSEGRTAFLAKAYGAIPESALIAKWTFDTEGDNQVSEGSNKWTAVCMESPSVFTDKKKPTFVEGIAGKAVYLENGAHLECSDYSEAAITPKDLSISVWVKTAKTDPGNYVISYNYWNTWKLNIQDQNKPFFTFAGNDGICDADNERDQSVKEGEWTMVTVVLSYNTHTLNFYINGELTKEWTAEQKPALTSTSWATYTSKVGALPLFIGLCTSEAEANSAWEWEWGADSLGAFYGAIDNLALYNVALTAGQVKKLYKDKM